MEHQTAAQRDEAPRDGRGWREFAGDVGERLRLFRDRFGPSELEHEFLDEQALHTQQDDEETRGKEAGFSHVKLRPYWKNRIWQFQWGFRLFEIATLGDFSPGFFFGGNFPDWVPDLRIVGAVFRVPVNGWTGFVDCRISSRRKCEKKATK